MADDPLEELSRDEKQALVNLVKNDNGFDLSRRDVLALAGGASLGAVLGGTGYSAMGSAKADASTSDSDGNVGLPNDPVDAWIEGLAGPTGSPIDLGSDIVPDTDASYDLGSSSNQFNNAYMSNAEVGSITDDSSGNSYDVDTLAGGSGDSLLSEESYPLINPSNNDKLTQNSTVLGLPSGELLACYNRTEQHTSGQVIVLTRSQDDGQTWSSETVIVDDTGAGYYARSPTLNLLPDGDLLLTYSRQSTSNLDNYQVGYRKSSDDGQTWSSFTAYDNRGYANNGYTVATNAHVTELDNGDLIQPLWAVDRSDLASSEIWVNTSTDGGDSWSYLSTIKQVTDTDPAFTEHTLTQLPSGDVLAIARRNQSGNQFEQFHSTDNGLTWTQDGTTETIQDVGAKEPILFMSDYGHVGLVYSMDGNIQRRGPSLSYQGYAFADPSSIVGDVTAWRDNLWFINDYQIEGTPRVAPNSDGENLIALNNKANLSDNSQSEVVYCKEKEAYRAIANNAVLEWDRTTESYGYESHPTIYSAGSTTFLSAGTPATSWTEVVLEDQPGVKRVPWNATKVRLLVDFTPDGTSGQGAYVDLSNESNGPLVRVGETANNTDPHRQTVEVPVSFNNSIYYKTFNVSSVDLIWKGYIV